MTVDKRALSFSIVIPTYQRRDMVCDSVRSFSALKYNGFIEIIVVVDGSMDGTAEALALLNSPFPIQIIEQANAGAGAARNRGAATATGDILLFCDDDMICEPDLIEQHARMYHDGADAVAGKVEIDAESPAGFITEGFAKWLRSCRLESRLTPFDIWTAQLSVRREVFKQIGGFDESFTAGSAFSQEDADFGVKLLSGFNVRYNPSAVSRLRYVVTPREQMQRMAKKAAGDVLFARKHPTLSRALWETNGVSRLATRFIYRPLSRVPFLPKVLGEIAIRSAEVGLRTRFQSTPLLARFFSLARLLRYWSAVRKNGGIADSDHLLILCYHIISENSSDHILNSFTVSSRLLEAHLESMRKRDFTFVGPDALAAFLAGAPLPRRAVLLTFDDCYAELPEIVREVLQPREIGTIAFAVTGIASNEWDQARGSAAHRLLSHAQLRELNLLGVEIGCHSRTHRDMRLLDDLERVEETVGAAEDLLNADLPRPRFFAYPYGSSDRRSRKAVEEAGYLAAFGLSQRYVSRSSSLFDLPRIMILASDKGWRFRLKTRFPFAYAHLLKRSRRLLKRA